VLTHHSLVHDCDCRHDICANHVSWNAQSIASPTAYCRYDRLDLPLPVSYDSYSLNDYPTLLWEHWVSLTSIVFAHCINVLPFSHLTHSAWCWITDTSVEASRLKIGSEYAYFWLAATVTFVLYGTIVAKWLRQATEERDRRLLRDAIFMGW
jgi:hypothetical protein